MMSSPTPWRSAVACRKYPSSTCSCWLFFLCGGRFLFLFQRLIQVNICTLLVGYRWLPEWVHVVQITCSTHRGTGAVLVVVCCSTRWIQFVHIDDAVEVQRRSRRRKWKWRRTTCTRRRCRRQPQQWPTWLGPLNAIPSPRPAIAFSQPRLWWGRCLGRILSSSPQQFYTPSCWPWQPSSWDDVSNKRNGPNVHQKLSY